MPSSFQSNELQRRLTDSHPVQFSAFCIAAAFGTYFCMYAFRKPFTAGTFENDALWGVGYKTVLVVSQVLGYTASKFIGVKFVSEMQPRYRAPGILLLIGIAHAALLLFAIVPPPYNFLCLFANGLPLGMVFGLVLGFLEGRRLTEALVAGLCASFIVSSGVVKSIGRYLVVEQGVSEYWMPFLTGLLFVPPLLICVWLLGHIPPPGDEDVVARSRRTPMNAELRIQFFRKYALGLSLLVGVYVLLTVLRSIRDDFAVEIWQDLGEGGKPAIFAWSELAVMFGVVIVNGAAILLRNNAHAFVTTVLLLIVSFGLVCLSTVGLTSGWLRPFPFMVLIGFALYVPYVAFHTTLFERLIAIFRDPGNIAFLMYVADAAGYLVYVGVVVVHDFVIAANADTDAEVATADGRFLDFFVSASFFVSLVEIALMIGILVYFRRRMRSVSHVGAESEA